MRPAFADKPPLTRCVRGMSLSLWTGLLFAGVAVAPAGAEPYRIEVGDVLEFSVASLPNLKQRTSVDINGEVNFPLLQDIHAADIPLAELRTKVRELISAKPFRQRAADGHETLLTIDPDEISISIAEYRPIYVTGDVGRPGEQMFRPGITVRQAVALSGGYDPAQMRLGNPAFQLADLRGENQTLSAQLMGNRATIARLQAELDNQADFQQALVDGAPVKNETQRAYIQRERDELGSRARDYTDEKAFLARSITDADQFLGVLSEQQSNEKQGVDLDMQDFNRVNELYGKGAVPITRVIDARRSLLLSSTRQLQTSVQVSESKARKENLIHDKDKLDDQRRAKLLEELQTASVASLDLEARSRAVSQKLAVLGKSGGGSLDDIPPSVKIFRQDSATVMATDDTVLEPGDVLKVKLSSSPEVSALNQ